MQTDRITIDNNGAGMTEALREAEKLSEYLELEKPEATKLRLLTEEALGMVRAVSGTFRGHFWAEATDKKDCKIHVETEGRVDYDTKQELISVSTSGKNESEKGIMRKIFAVMERGVHGIEEVNRMQAQTGGPMIMFGSLGMYEPEGVMLSGAWSLAAYRENLESRIQEEGRAQDEDEAWDELEKSIVASIADDVKVYVKSDHAEIVIEKRF